MLDYVARRLAFLIGDSYADIATSIITSIMMSVIAAGNCITSIVSLVATKQLITNTFVKQLLNVEVYFLRALIS